MHFETVHFYEPVLISIGIRGGGWVGWWWKPAPVYWKFVRGSQNADEGTGRVLKRNAPARVTTSRGDPCRASKYCARVRYGGVDAVRFLRSSRCTGGPSIGRAAVSSIGRAAVSSIERRPDFEPAPPTGRTGIIGPVIARRPSRFPNWAPRAR